MDHELSVNLVLQFRVYVIIVARKATKGGTTNIILYS
jgi:hypothetical protein